MDEEFLSSLLELLEYITSDKDIYHSLGRILSYFPLESSFIVSNSLEWFIEAGLVSKLVECNITYYKIIPLKEMI